MRHSFNKNKLKGFTLAELLVVVAIIAVLVAVSIPIFTAHLEKSRRAVCQANRTNVVACYRVSYMTGENTSEIKDALEKAIAKTDISATVTSIGAYTFKIEGLCVDNGIITAVCDDNGGINLSCSKHSDVEDDGSGASTQASAFTTFMNAWMEENGYTDLSGNRKSALYAAYYAAHPEAVQKMSDEYKQTLVAAGLNNTIKQDLYWWSYPITDDNGVIQYTITYANTVNDPSAWNSTSSSYKTIIGGYVVKVNGKTYIRSQSGTTAQPGYSESYKKYPTTDALEQDLINKGYIAL